MLACPTVEDVNASQREPRSSSELFEAAADGGETKGQFSRGSINPFCWKTRQDLCVRWSL